MFDVLEGEHIVLRKAVEKDALPMLKNVWSVPEIYESMLFQPTMTEEDAIDRCRRSIAFQKEHYAYFVADKETDEAIGFAGINEFEPGRFEECGGAVCVKCQGRGYGTEIVALLLDLAFSKLGALDFKFGYFQENVRSKKIAAHFGFTYDHTYELTRPWDGSVHVIDSCLLTREQYFRRFEKMNFTEPSIEYAEQIRAYRQAFLACGSSMDGTGALRRIEDPEQWVRFCEKNKKKETTPENLVPATQYMFVRENDAKIVGMLQIRHYFNDRLAKYGGHIGYSVAPDERRKGYASRMLKIALTKCKELGIPRVLITCNDDNEASRRTILKNGGVYESTIHEPDENVDLERYWIEVKG